MALKLFFVTGVFSSLLFANAIDTAVLKFEKKRFSQNSQIEVTNVQVNTKKALPLEGWHGYIIDVTAQVQGKELKAKDMVFTNGKYVTPELFDIKTGASLKDSLSPSLSAEYYNKAHLIAGNHKAKDKIVIFSDPLCPFCMDYVPDVIKHVQKNAQSIALYYYHFPLLRLHPAADALTKLMDLAKQRGIKDIELKVYGIDWDKHFSERETNHQKVIDAFNKEFKTNFTFTEVMSKEIREGIRADMVMGEEVMVQGTPTIFVNGEKDNSKLKYETLGK